MLSAILCIYSSIITFVVAITVACILLGKSWGDIPKIYAAFVIYLQENFGIQLDEESLPGKRLKIIERRHYGRFIDHIVERYSGLTKGTDITNENNNNNVIDLSEEELNFEIFDIQAEFLQAGVEAIIQDDLLFTCEFSPINYWNFLSSPFSSVYNGYESLQQWVLYCSSLGIRFLFLLPIRICLLIASIIFLTTAAIFSFIHQYSHEQVVYIGKAFSRLFCASIGVIGNYIDGNKNQPKAPGIATANHLSANDIQLLFADAHDWGYTVTGQKHGGIIGWVEKTAGRIGSTLWLERANANERKEFQKSIISYASNETKDPILLFPEGYCSNGTAVSQFRKACFVENVDFYPISITQDPRLGDAFWREDTYLPYLFRLMTSFGIIYNVRYLPPMRRSLNEPSEKFAQRIQERIAYASNIDAIPFDLSVLKRVSEQKRIHEYSQNQFAQMISKLYSNKYGPMIMHRG
jgi:glycerol-3-phosphate O-acyltransferase 3/4